MNARNENVNFYDQAEDLRSIISERKPLKRKVRRTFTISILSGKGGVGKSNIAASLSCALADLGRNVVLIDADLGMANLDILCGVKTKYNLAHLIAGSRNLNEILIPLNRSEKSIQNNGSVLLLPGGVGLREIADLGDDDAQRVFESLAGLEELADYLIMDAGAGIHRGVLSFGYASDITLLVTSPEPTSVRDAYGVIKSLGSEAWLRNNGAGLMLVVNMAVSRKQAHDVADRIRVASTKFLGNAPVYLGYVLKDPVVEKSVGACRIFYKTYPGASASACVTNLAVELLRLCEGIRIRNQDKKEIRKINSEGIIKSFFRKVFRENK